MGKPINFNTLPKGKKDEIISKIKSRNYSIRQIANEYRVDVGNINKLAKSMGIHGCKAVLAVSTSSPVVTNANEAESLNGVNNMENGKILSTKKIGARGNRYSEEEKINMVLDIEEQLKNGTFKKLDFSDKYGVSLTFIRNLANDFKLELPDERKINKEESELKQKKTTKKVSKKDKDSKININDIIEEQLAEEASIMMDIDNDAYDPLAEVEEAIEKEIVEEKEILSINDNEDDILLQAEIEADKIISDIDKFNNQDIIKEVRGNIELIHPVRTKIDPILKVGLISNRHKLPVGKCIYHSLSDSDIMKFDQLYIDALQFIDRNIPFEDGKASRSIDLYVTGAVMVNAAVIKACLARKINLDLYHFNKQTLKYECQHMLSGFPMNIGEDDNTIFDFFSNDVREESLTVSGFESLNEIKKRDTFYIVRIGKFHNAWSTKVKSWETCICKDLNTAFDVYKQFTTDIINAKEKSNIYCNIQLSLMTYNPEGTISFGDCISMGKFGMR